MFSFIHLIYNTLATLETVVTFICQGWNDVGFHDSEIETPNIDALAYDGIILNKYYVSPICSPTRSAIMTGRHPIHTGTSNLPNSHCLT